MSTIQKSTVEDRLYTYGTQLDASFVGEVSTSSQFMPLSTSPVLNALRNDNQQPTWKRKGALALALGASLVVGFSALRAALPSHEETVAAPIVVGSALNNAPRVFPPGTEWVFPVDAPYSFTDTFGAPRMTGTEYEHAHQGIDIFAALGTPVRAIRAGVVSKIGISQLGGNRLWLTDKYGNAYYYAHLDSFHGSLVEGGQVSAGQILAFVGTTGNAPEAPPHLHVEIHEGLTGPINPTPILLAMKEVATPDLVTVNEILVARPVAEPLRMMLAAAKKAGHTMTGGGYRSSAAQIAVRLKNCGTSPTAVFVMPSSACTPPTAKPGVSAHERGTAIDFVVNGRAIRAGMPATQWLQQNAARFGFTGKPAEPWHWEFTGK
jgi:murein DD-endopeptidase MepM/ murein hydrolase activator NlpD